MAFIWHELAIRSYHCLQNEWDRLSFKKHTFFISFSTSLYGLSRGSSPESKSEKRERELVSKKMPHSMNQIDTDDEQHFREEKKMK